MSKFKDWSISESSYGDEYWFGGDDGFAIDVGPAVIGGPKSELEEARKAARLISAAPEMLEALYAAEATLSSEFSESEIASTEEAEPVRLIRAAIAKAEGKTP